MWSFGIDGFVLVPVTGGTGTATVDSLDELVTMTRAMTSPTTRSTATAARIHSQRGDFGGPGGGLRRFGGLVAALLPRRRQLFGGLSGWRHVPRAGVAGPRTP